MAMRSLEEVELQPRLGEALSQYLAGEVGRPSGGGDTLNSGGFSQAREQALQTFVGPG
jgi:hypothetical protein